MHTIGIDMSKDTFHAAFDDSKISVFQNSDDGIETFIKSLHSCGAIQTKTLLGVESTGVYHLLLCDRLTFAGWQIRVINPILTARIGASRIRHVKTDAADAQMIRTAVLSGMGYQYTDSRDIQTLKSLLSQRMALARMRAKLKQIKAAHAMRSKVVVAPVYDSTTAPLLALTKEIQTIEREMRKYAPETQKLLRTIPGIGITCASTLVATIGDINRFDSPEKLVAYLGLDCRVFQSGTSINGKGYISKRGNHSLRTLLFLAAFHARRHDADLAAFFLKKRNEGKHYFVALCAVERKLIHRIYAVWKRRTPYSAR